MNTATTPIATTTTLSVLLHVAVIAVFLLLYEQTATIGHGINIELVSSIRTSAQQDTVKPHGNNRVIEDSEQSTVTAPLTGKAVRDIQHNKVTQAVVSSLRSDNVVASSTVSAPARQQARLKDRTIKELPLEKNNNAASPVQSGNTVEHRQSIIELLHDSISKNREYPYLARRQRREGIATIGFLLHPDGSVENTHLVTSSRSGALDRAALSAVKRIEPFTQARDYLRQAEEFRIDVVFKLL